jgi:PAS domain S-box-containing protein
LLGSLDLGIVLVGRDLRVRRFTPFAQQEWRLQPSDIGRALTDTRLGVHVPVLQRLAAEAIAHARPQAREIRDPRGRWHSLKVLPFRSADGAIEGAVATLTDVHALKLAQDRFRAFLESAPDATVIVDSGGRIELVNAQLERLLGYRRDELVGRPLETLLPPDPRERRRLARYLGDRWLPPTGARRELEARRKDGGQVPVEVSLSRIETEEGALVSSAIRDVTERRQLEERARRAAVSDERNRLAKEVHDSIAQGLTAIVVQLEGAEEILTSDPEEARRQVLRARDLARHDLEEARRALLALRPGPLDVGDLPEAIRGIAEPLAVGVELEVSVRGRRGRLLPLLEDNLLRIAQEAVSNALKHAGASRVRADLTFARDAFRMRIEDDGCGFEPRQTGSGVGLGLSIMRERAERMGAELRVRSRRARGTCVEVRVPLADSAPRG